MVDARMPERWLSDRRLLRLSDGAFRTFATALLWSVSNRTDGLIEHDDLALVPRASEEHADELEAAGLFATCDEGWLIVDFQGTQTSRDELQVLENIRRRDREKKARQRAEARAESAIVPGDIPGEGPGVQSRGTAQARPGKALEEQEVSPFCDRHPGGTDEPCVRCMNRRRAYEERKEANAGPSVPLPGRAPMCPKHPEYTAPGFGPIGCDRCNEEAEGAEAA